MSEEQDWRSFHIYLKIEFCIRLNLYRSLLCHFEQTSYRLILVFHFRSETFLSAQLTTFIFTLAAVFNSITNQVFTDGSGASSRCAVESFVQTMGGCFVRMIVTMEYAITIVTLVDADHTFTLAWKPH